MAARRKSPATTKTLAAPVGGLNTRDALGAMPDTDAVILQNYFPATTDVRARFGYTRWATGMGSMVETILAYSGGTTDKLFSIAGGSVYNCTAGGAVGAAELAGLSNSRWQYVNIATPGGNFIEMVNGTDAPVLYDGTTWSNPSITGVTASQLNNINVHKNRLWFCQNGSLKAWYLPVQSVAGAVNALDLSSFAPHGGYLMAMGTWTMDAGYGIDDMAVFVTSNGDVLVYRGTDPSSASTWALVGVFYTGSPIGRRCFTKYKGDLLLICQDGLAPLSAYLQSSRLNARALLTDKIQFTISNAVTQFGNNFGWECLAFSGENMLILNVPYGTQTGQQQLVMNTISGAWGNFTNWNAACWELYQDRPYYGSYGFLAKAWEGNTDAGDDIPFDGLQAFNSFGNSGYLKRFTMIRPTLYCNGAPAVQGNMNLDYDTAPPTATFSITPTTYASWDGATSTWDNALWGASLSVSRNWQGASGVGYVAAPRVLGAVNGLEFRWIDTTVVFEPGGIL